MYITRLRQKQHSAPTVELLPLNLVNIDTYLTWQNQHRCVIVLGFANEQIHVVVPPTMHVYAVVAEVVLPVASQNESSLINFTLGYKRRVGLQLLVYIALQLHLFSHPQINHSTRQ